MVPKEPTGKGIEMAKRRRAVRGAYPDKLLDRWLCLIRRASEVSTPAVGAEEPPGEIAKIGRASCRERVS